MPHCPSIPFFHFRLLTERLHFIVRPFLAHPGSLTPTLALLPQLFGGSEPSQVELDLRLETQSEYAAYSWETNRSLWSTASDMHLGDDFGFRRHPSKSVPKYQEDLGAPRGIEFGQALTQARTSTRRWVGHGF